MSRTSVMVRLYLDEVMRLQQAMALSEGQMLEQESPREGGSMETLKAAESEIVHVNNLLSRCRDVFAHKQSAEAAERLLAAERDPAGT